MISLQPTKSRALRNAPHLRHFHVSYTQFLRQNLVHIGSLLGLYYGLYSTTKGIPMPTVKRPLKRLMLTAAHVTQHQFKAPLF